MKCTDFSKLHLAKRVYFDRKNFKNVSCIEPIKDCHFEISFDDGSAYFFRKDGTCVDDYRDIIAFDIDEPLSEERSAYIEKISREAMGKMRENFGLDLAEKAFFQETWHAETFADRKKKYFDEKNKGLITMQFTKEELERIHVWYCCSLSHSLFDIEEDERIASKLAEYLK